jgi:hypothetical protein
LVAVTHTVQAIQAFQEMLMYDNARSAMIIPLIRNPDVTMKLNVFWPPIQHLFILSELRTMECLKSPGRTMPPSGSSLIKSIDFLHHLDCLFKRKVCFVDLLEQFSGSFTYLTNLVVRLLDLYFGKRVVERFEPDL